MHLRLFSLQQFILYMTIISAFVGSLVLSIEIGPVHLFPFRFFLFIICSVFLITIIIVNNGRLNLAHIKVKLFLQFLALWFCYAFVSMIWAAEKVDAFKNIIFLFTGISLVFFIVYYYRSLNNLKWLYWLFICIFVALLPIAIWEITTGNHLEVSKMFEETRERIAFMPSTVFFNPNDYAAYIVLTCPMIYTLVRYSSSWLVRVLGIPVIIMCLWILVMTMSRSSYIALLMGLTFWFLFLLHWKHKIKILAVACLSAIILMFVFFTQIMDLLETIEKQMVSLNTLVSQGGGDTSIDTRLNLMKNGIVFAAESLGFGVGAGNAEYYLANCAIYPVGGIAKMHNWWMEIMVNYGLFIFCGYVILYLSILYNLWRIHKCADNVTEKMICEALLISWVSFFMASISSSSIMAFPPQWIYLGFTLAFLNYSKINVRNNTIILHGNWTG